MLIKCFACKIVLESAKVINGKVINGGKKGTIISSEI